MKKTSEQTGMVGRILRPILIGTSASSIVCMVVLALSALCVAALQVPKTVLTPLAVSCAGIGCLSGGLIAARISRERGLLYGAACGLLLFLIFEFIGLLAFGDIGGVYAIVKAVVMTLCGAVGGIAGISLRRR